MRAFTDDDLGAVYKAVGGAQMSGAFRGRHGPLEVTAWLHLSIADLERLDDALAALTLGDDRALTVLRSLGQYEKPILPCTTDDSLDEDELQAAPIGIADPVALAVAAHMISDRGDQAAADRLIWFAVRRTAAVNLALSVAERSRAGWFSAKRLESRLRRISPLAIDNDSQHAHGSRWLAPRGQWS